MTDLTDRDAIVANAIEAEFRQRLTCSQCNGFGIVPVPGPADPDVCFECDGTGRPLKDPAWLRPTAEAAALRARRDLAEAEASVREMREAANEA